MSGGLFEATELTGGDFDLFAVAICADGSHRNVEFVGDAIGVDTAEFPDPFLGEDAFFNGLN